MSVVNERLVNEAAGRLADGGWEYTPRQLYYAVCAAAEPPPTRISGSQMGCGAVLFVLGAGGGMLGVLYLAPVAIIGMIVFALGVQALRRERERPTVRPLALSWLDFEQKWAQPQRLHGAEPIAGLLPHAGVSPLPPADRADTLLIVDREETAACLRANAAAAGFDLPVDVLRAGTDLAGRTAFTLHDADPEGCALPVRVRQAGAAAVRDIGLRPGQVVGRAQVIEGAPNVVPVDVARVLSPDESVWLANGCRVELAVVPPALLMTAVVDALRDMRVATTRDGIDLLDVVLLTPPPDPIAAAVVEHAL